MVLCSDATIITETPPLRASWSPVGDPARIAISGNRHKAALFGALNIGTGQRCLDLATRWNGETFRTHRRHIRRVWSGWHIVLFLDRGSPHTAAASRALADELNIELRWLPTACPELNPVESLWRWLKGRILCNHQPENFEDTTSTAIDAMESLTPRKALTMAGALSKDFWLRT